MKIYVDELPKDCFDCPCFRNDIEICCGLDDGIKDYHNFVEDSTCLLATTQSLKQQVREEVVDEIFYNLSRIEDTLINCGNGKEDALAYFCEILKKVKGESNVKD